MKVIDQINESGIFAQSAYSAATATKDGSGRIITDTYLTNDKESYWYRQGSGISGQMALVDDTYAIQVRVSGKNQADETASITAGIILPGASPTSAKQLATFTTGGHVAWVEAPFIATEMGLAFISDVESAVSGKQDTLTFGYNSNNKINSINNSALAGEGGGAEYEGIDPIVVDNGEHKISANTWDLAVGDGLSAQDDIANNTTTILLTGDYYSASNPSGFITGVDLTPYQTTADMTAYQAKADMTAYATTAQLADKLDSTAFSTVSGSFLTAIPSDVVTTGDLTASSNWDSTYDTVHDNSASWTGGGAGGDMFVSGLAYTTGGEISSYSGSAFVSTDPTFELNAGYGISMTTAANSLTIANTLVLETGSI